MLKRFDVLDTSDENNVVQNKRIKSDENDVLVINVVPESLIAALRVRVMNLYKEVADNHWERTSECNEFKLHAQNFGIVNALFLIASNISVKKNEKLKCVCDKIGCVAPHHHRLVSKQCTKENWTQREFEACEQHLFYRSQSCANPNPVITVPGNCRLWKGWTNPRGYAEVTFLSWNTKAHILSYATKIKCTSWIGTVRHLCNNESCIEPNHLTTGTQSNQEDDKIANGTSNHGENSAHAKLTTEQAREIKFRPNPKESVKQFAKTYGITESAISCIDLAKSWAWLGKNEAEDDKKIKSKQKQPKAMLFEDWTNEYKQECRDRIKRNSTTTEVNVSSLSSDCWLSKYHRHPDGYCSMTAHGKSYGVHRLSYMLKIDAQVPPGLQVTTFMQRTPYLW